jgi:hypothetical protein
LQQYGKLNSTAQHDEQHNTTLRSRNHEKTQKTKVYLCEKSLIYIKRTGKKRCRGMILDQK